MDTIKDNNHFLRAYKKGRYLHSGFLTVHIVANGLANGLDSKRYGITVSKKLGNAVVRNRCKRIIRAALHEIQNSLPESFDYVFIARDKLCSMKSTDLLPFFTDRLLAFANRGVK
jgi:ribonuclease P protein component